MGTGYTRNDTSNNIADGNIINASDLDGEFDAIESAMGTSGHTHDGTSAEGGPVTVVGPVQDLVVSATEVKPKTDNTLDLGTSSLQFKNAYFQGTVDTDGIMTAATFEPDGDTAAGDNAAIGYTAAEGLILTGQGSTNDVTIKNDADADVLEIPTGTTNVTIAGNLGVGGTVTGTGTSVFASLDISGDIDVDGTTNLDVVDIDGAVDFASTTAHAGNATFADNAKAIFGAGSDLQIFHDGSNSYIQEGGTGQLVIRSEDLRLQDASGTNWLQADTDGAVRLYHNNSNKLATTSTGVDVTGNATFADNGQAIFGAGSDLTILHNGSDSTITNATGTLTIQNTADDEDVDIVSDDGSGGTAVYFRADGSSGQAKLYHNNAGTGTLRLNTSSDGIDIVGHADIEGHFTATDGCTITTADNSTQLTLTSTDDDATEGPRLDLRRDSASPANGDLIGTIRYLGDDDGGTTTVFGEIQLEADDVPDGSEDGEMRLMIRNNGNLRNAVEIGSTEVVFNEASDDVDFRVESDNATHALFVQGSDGNVGIGTGSPSSLFEVNKGSAGTLATFTDGVNSNFVVETASLITTVGNTGGSTALAFKSSNTERMRIDASGNVGIGTSSPQATAEISGGLDNRLRINSTDGTTSNNYGIDFSTAGTVRGGIRYNAGNNYLAFYGYDNTERLRIDSNGALNGPPSANFDIKTGSGTGDMRFFTNGSQRAMVGADANLFVGTTSTAPNPGVVLQPFGNIGIGNSNANSGASFLEFRRNTTQIGGVTQSGTTGVSYNTSSDYRLKENVTDVTDGITRVKQLAPKRFNFIADPDTTVDGFLAHEAQAVVPEAVTGTHNEVDDDGNAKMQGIDQAKLVPLLTAALQEAIAKIETLETKVAALEGA